MKLTKGKKLFGTVGELSAAAVFLIRGYWPVAFHYQHPAAEIDVVCRRGKTLLLVEVKTRKRWADHDNAFHYKQNERQEMAKSRLQQTYPAHEVKRALARVSLQWPFVKKAYL